METPLDPAQALLHQEHAAALPYMEYPPTPRWFPPAAGAWAAAMLATVLYLAGEPAMIPALLALVAVEVVFFVWYRGKRGTSPSLRGAPPEFRRAFGRYAVGVVAVLLAVLAAALWLPHLAAVVLCFLLVTAGLAAYEVVYRDAADAARARLQ